MSTRKMNRMSTRVTSLSRSAKSVETSRSGILGFLLVPIHVQLINQSNLGIFQESLFRRGDRRFVWNRHLLLNFTSSTSENLNRYLLPLLHGFVQIETMYLHNVKVDYILISRRSAWRAGVRLYSRGIDASGAVANYVETEAMAIYNSRLVSYVQSRGSAPIYWSQKPNLR